MQKSNLDNYFNSYMAPPKESSKSLTPIAPTFDLKEYLKNGMSESELLKLKETFDLFDIDNSGFISPIKLRAAFKTHANLSVTKETIYHMICEFDNDEYDDEDDGAYFGQDC